MKELNHSFSPVEQATLRRQLLRWYRANRRDLPWRAHRDPYAIWVSEVMLQQTQVTAVIPYFQRFLSLFPSVIVLARSDEQTVLRAWEGLGYYRRARHLHQAAKVIVAQHAGQLPRDAGLLEQLPGFGRYTVGAVLSQAYDQRQPIVDANVARVLCRLLAWQSEVEARNTQNWLWDTARKLLPSKGSGDFNQSLMELGQTVCTTGEPSCLLCPLRDICRGRAQGLASTLPNRRTKVRSTIVKEAAILIWNKGRILLAQRRANSTRWANMWEFPSFEIKARPIAKKISERCHALTGYRVNDLLRLGSLQYGITRFQVTLDVFEASLNSGRPHQRHYQKLAWVKPEELSEYPLSVPQRRVAKRWLVSQ